MLIPKRLACAWPYRFCSKQCFKAQSCGGCSARKASPPEAGEQVKVALLRVQQQMETVLEDIRAASQRRVRLDF
jgi:hypothetical protein